MGGRNLEDTRALTLQYTRADGPIEGAPDELANGTRVGAYRVIEKIASGGGGTVYRAEGAAGPVAIKVMLRELAASPQALVRFQRESAAVRMFDHPNIVDVLDSGALPDGRPYIVMELVVGENLRELLRRRGRLSFEEALEILEPTCSALAAAHAAGVVHRDLKASNIAVGTGDRPAIKLLDFGIAKLTQADPSLPALTTLGTRLGTPYAMAPEQIRGDAVDARADVYALGVLMFQMLTGRYPFDGATAQEIERAHLEVPPPRPGQYAPVPAALEAVVLRCLEKPPAARFASVTELLAAFRDALAASPDSVSSDERQALSVLVEIAAAPGTDSDDLVEEAAEVMDLAAGELVAAGFMLALETGNLVLGVRLGEEAERREQALQVAVGLARQIELRPGGEPSLSVRVAMHTGLVQVSGGKIVGGELLRTSSWPLERERDGVQLSVKAMAGLA